MFDRIRASRGRFVAGTAASFSSIGLVKSLSRAAQFEFKCGSNQALEHPATIRLTQMWNAIEKESGGRIRTQFFPNSQLGGDSAMFSQLRLGALAFFFIGAGNLATVVPPADIGYLGFAFRDPAEGIRTMDGPLGNFIRQEAAAKDIHVMRKVWNIGMQQIIAGNHPIRTPDDLHGFKIRLVPSRISVDLLKAFGANPTSFTFDELYTAMQTKIVDGAVLNLVTVETSRFYEVQKFISLTRHQWAGNWLIANGSVWKNLPADLQQIVERNNVKYATLESNDLELGDIAFADKLGRQGIAFNRVDDAPFRSLLRPYYETWASAFGPTEWGLLESSLRKKLI